MKSRARASTGAGHFAHGLDNPVLFPDTIIAAPVDLRELKPAYLETIWSMPYIRRQIESVARTTNGTYKINQQTLQSVLLPVPPPDLQLDFQRATERIKTMHAKLAAREWNDLSASLVQRFFGKGSSIEL